MQAHVKVGSYDGELLLLSVEGYPAFNLPCPGIYVDMSQTPTVTTVGGTNLSVYAPRASDCAACTYYGCPGDMADIQTSPTDIAFVFFHMNLDRMNLQWLDNLNWVNNDFDLIQYPSVPYSAYAAAFEQAANPDIDVAASWNLAAKESGTLLDDVVNAYYPFKKGIFFGEAQEGSNTGYYTHRDLLLATYHGLPYRYENSSVYYTSGKCTVTVSQSATFAAGTAWSGDLATVGSAGYGVALGTYSVATAKWLDSGCVASSSVTSRRAGTTVKLSAATTAARSANAQAAASTMTAASLQTSMQAANAALGLSVTMIPLATAVSQDVTTASLSSSDNDDTGYIAGISVLSCLVCALLLLPLYVLATRRSPELKEGDGEATVVEVNKI